MTRTTRKDGEVMESLGTGVLSWKREERVGDRYGTVRLFPDTEAEDPTDLNETSYGLRGRLVAVVKETRQSPHIGDLFHGVFPVTPEVGEKIVLGEGILFYEDNSVGLNPDTGRETLWLDVPALYRAHHQTVELFFDES